MCGSFGWELVGCKIRRLLANVSLAPASGRKEALLILAEKNVEEKEAPMRDAVM
jgi:hypothetical protein